MTLEAEPLGQPDFDEQFAALFDLAYRVAYRILGRRDEAMDMAQETLARTEQRWGRVGDEPWGWVSKVAANLAIGVWRKEHRRPPTPSGSTTTGVEEQVVERLDLVNALRRLPRRQRQVVILRYLADRSEAEVAETLRCSIGSVKTHASRGLAALRAGRGGG